MYKHICEKHIYKEIRERNVKGIDQFFHLIWYFTLCLNENHSDSIDPYPANLIYSNWHLLEAVSLQVAKKYFYCVNLSIILANLDV